MAGFTDDRGMQIWRADQSGKLIMPDKQSDFLDWMLSDAREPASEQEWCAENDIPRGTVKKWKQDRRFKEMWERRANDRATDPERIKRVTDALYKAATDRGDISAQKQYLAWVEKFMPPKEIKRDNSVAHMTDAELRAEIEAILADGFGQ